MNKRPLATVGIIFLITLAASARMTTKLSLTISVVAAILGIAVSFFVCDYRKIILLISITVSIGCGIMWFNLKYYENLSTELGEKTCMISGEVTDMPQKKYGRWYYEVKTDYIGIKNAPQNIKIRLTCRNSIEAQEGDRISGQISFIRTESETGYENEIALRADGIAAKAYCSPYTEMNVSEGGFSLKIIPIKIRRSSIKAVRKAFPERYSGMLCAMLLGDTTYIADDVADNFRVAGIAHLMAVSGFHVSLLATCIMFILKKTKLMPNPRLIITIAAIFLFMAVTGFSPSVVRAGIMHIMALTAMLIKRDSDSITSVALSVLIMCIINPMSACDIGLQMSVCSTLGIMLFSDGLGQEINHRLPSSKYLFLNNLRSYAIESTAVSITASLCTMPLSAVYFGNVSLIAPLTNLLCIYAGSLFIALGTVTTAIYSLPFIGKLLAFIPKLITLILGAFLDAVTTLFSSFPLAAVNTNRPFIPWFISVTVIALASGYVFLRICRDEKTIRMIKSLIFCGISAVLLIGTVTDEIFFSGSEIVVFGGDTDGICVMAKCGTHAMISEAGGDDYDMHNISRVIGQCGVQHIDAVTVSEDNKNRSGIADELIEKYSPDYVALGGKGSYAFARKAVSAEKAELVDFKNEIVNASLGLSVLLYEDRQSKCWQLISSGETSVLICPEGGDCSELPSELRKCDAVVIGDANVKNVICLTTGAAIIAASSDESNEIAAILRVKGINKVYQRIDGTYRLRVENNRLYILCD